jgi:hypothetical protein
VVARDQTGVGDPTKLAPLAPLVDVSPLPTDGTLTVMAVKARTSVAWTTGRVVAVTTLS